MKIVLWLASVLVFPTVLVSCGGENCGNIETSSHSVMALCFSDCSFAAPETYQIVQSDCVASVEGFHVEELAEDFDCVGLLVLSPGVSSDYFISSEQVCTGSKGTTCNIAMAEAVGACP